MQTILTRMKSWTEALYWGKLSSSGVAKVTEGGVSGGWSMSDLLRERRGSDGRQRDRLRREPITGQTALKGKKGVNGA